MVMKNMKGFRKEGENGAVPKQRNGKVQMTEKSTPLVPRKSRARRIKFDSLLGFLFTLTLFMLWKYQPLVSQYIYWGLGIGGITKTSTTLFADPPPPRASILDVSRGIERRSNLSLKEFVKLYDAKWPVIVTDVMQTWPAMEKWSTEYFIRNYGQKRVYFHGVQGSLNEREGLAAPLAYFLEHIHLSEPRMWSYIGDEIFLMRHPELRKDVKRPIYIKEDLFALFPEDIRPWNLMLLWGSRFSRSTLHIDPYNWTGTNAVIKGKKSWKLYPPGQDHLLYVQRGRRCGFPLDCVKYNSAVDTFDYNPNDYPLLKEAKAIEFDQYPGEMLFIPTGWFHQAYNKEETLAVSSQVMNSQNYRQILDEIFKGGSVRQRDIPHNLDSMSPSDQVKSIVSAIPASILARGKQVNHEQVLQLGEN